MATTRDNAPLPPPIHFSPGQNSWKFFLDRMENTFKYCLVTSEDIKKYYLLASLSDGVRGLLGSLCFPEEPSEKTFEELKSLLTAHYTPVKTTFSCRSVFYSARQQSGESALDFAVRIRSLASACGFKLAEFETVIRDMFVLGLGDRRIRDRLQKEDPLSQDCTFIKMVRLASVEEDSLKLKVDSPITQNKEPPGSCMEPFEVCIPTSGCNNNLSSECRFKTEDQSSKQKSRHKVLVNEDGSKSTDRGSKIVLDYARSEATFRHTVHRFSKVKEIHFSPPFFVRKLPWKIMVMPQNFVKDRPLYLGLFLKCIGNSKNTTWCCHAHGELRLLSQKEGGSPFCKEFKHLFFNKEDDWGFLYFIGRDEVLNPEKGYIKDDTIILEVHIQADAPQIVKRNPKDHR